MFIDTHAHLDDRKLARDLDGVLRRALEAGVERIVTVGADLPSSRRAAGIARARDRVWATVGIHPHDAASADSAAMGELARLAGEPKVAAIGETGLDYYRDLSPRQAQRDAFEQHIDLALRMDLPLVVHCRDAWEECLEILERRAPEGLRGVAHCFSGDAAVGARLRAIGFLVSFAGNVTYPNAENLRAAAAQISAESLLVETDCPYLPPQPVRKQRNEPAFVVHTAAELARVYGLSVEDVARVTTFNADRLFGLGAGEERETIVYPIRKGLYVNLTNRCSNRCRFCARETAPHVKGHSLALAEEPGAEAVEAAIGDASRYDEIVFCGFGEPTLRLDVLKQVAAWVKRTAPATRVRVNTNGHGSLLNDRPICAELKGLVDAVSVSINAGEREAYAHLCRPEAGEGAFDAMLAFVREAREALPEVVVTAIDMPGADLAACQRLADELGVPLRVRKYDDVGTPE